MQRSLYRGLLWTVAIGVSVLMVADVEGGPFRRRNRNVRRNNDTYQTAYRQGGLNYSAGATAAAPGVEANVATPDVGVGVNANLNNPRRTTLRPQAGVNVNTPGASVNLGAGANANQPGAGIHVRGQTPDKLDAGASAGLDARTDLSIPQTNSNPPAPPAP